MQVGALVVGHVAALVLAHDRALELYGSARAATRSQVVMLILMVAFTCLGLWLLSAALQRMMPLFAHAGPLGGAAAVPRAGPGDDRRAAVGAFPRTFRNF